MRVCSMPRKKLKRITKKKVSKKKTSLLRPFLQKLFSYTNRVIFSLGVIFILLALGYKADQYVNSMIVNKKPAVVSCVENKTLPSHLSIPELGISAPVEESAVIGNLWQVSPENISHLDTSAVPGERGNIVIYGHNSKNRFSKLEALKNGSYITLKTKENKSYVYVVQSKIITFPDDTRLIKSTDKEALTIYTCNGLLDSLRLVIRAVPVYETAARAEDLACTNGES